MRKLSFLNSIKKMPVMELPVRSTQIAVKDGSVLYSPGSMLTREQLQTLDNVTDIVAPNMLHAAGVKLAAEVFPKARIWGVRGLETSKPNIAWTHELSPSFWPYQDELVLIPLQGLPKLNEAVLVHRESRTLILADLAFNVIHPEGIGAWMIMNMFGTYDKFAVSRLFSRMVADKKAFEHSLAELFSYNFDNIVVGHGDMVLGQGKNLLRNALQERGFAIPMSGDEKNAHIRRPNSTFLDKTH